MSSRAGQEGEGRWDRASSRRGVYFIYSTGRERLGENSPGHVIEFRKYTPNFQMHYNMTKFSQDHRSVPRVVLLHLQVLVMLWCHAMAKCHAEVVEILMRVMLFLQLPARLER